MRSFHGGFWGYPTGLPHAQKLPEYGAIELPGSGDIIESLMEHVHPQDSLADLLIPDV